MSEENGSVLIPMATVVPPPPPPNWWQKQQEEELKRMMAEEVERDYEVWKAARPFDGTYPINPVINTRTERVPGSRYNCPDSKETQ